MLTSLKDQYIKIMSDHICISKDDLTDTEKELIEHSFEMFIDKLEDIKTLNGEVRRLSIELANTKAMLDTSDDRKNNYENDED